MDFTNFCKKFNSTNLMHILDTETSKNYFVELRSDEDYARFQKKYENNARYSISFKPSGCKKKDQLSTVNFLMVDLDLDSIEEQERKLLGVHPKLPILNALPNLKVHTGSRGYHAYWFLDRNISLSEAVDLQKGIIVALRADPSLIDYTKSMRVPGFLSHKTGNVSTAIEHHHIRRSPQDFAQFLVSDLEWDIYRTKHNLINRFKEVIEGWGINVWEDFNVTKLNKTRLKKVLTLLAKGDIEGAKEWLTSNTTGLRELISNNREQKDYQELSQKFVTTPEGYNSSDILHYLAERYCEGYDYNGREEFATCKCPLHGGDSDDSLHISKEGGFLRCHAGCDAKDVVDVMHELAAKAGDPYAYTSWVDENNGFKSTRQLHQKYLDFETSSFLTAIRAAKGTGKTEWLTKIKGPKLGVTHRTKLNHALSERLHIPHIDAVKGEIPESLVMCMNSLHQYGKGKFNVNQWKGATLIIDEVTQVVDALLNSPLMQERRVTILENLRKLVNVVGGIVLLDADLDNDTVEFFTSLIERKVSVEIVENTYKPLKEAGVEIKTYGGANPSQLLESATVRLAKGEKIAVYTTSAKLTSTWSTKALYDYFIELGCSAIVVDADSVNDPMNELYNLENLEVLAKYQAVIYSPVISTGVSILHPVDAVYGINYGNQSVRDFSQGLFRYRATCPREVWVSPLPLSKPTMQGLDENTVRSNLLASGKMLSSLVQLNGSGFDLTMIDHWVKTQVQKNLELINYRKEQFKVFHEEGYTIQMGGNGIQEEIVETIGDLKGERILDYVEQIEAVPNPTVKELHDAKNNHFSQDVATKGDLLEYYGPVLDADLIQTDLQSDYRKELALHYEYENLDRDGFKHTSYGNSDSVFLPDELDGNVLILQALKEIGLDSVLSNLEEEAFTYESEWVQELRDKLKALNPCLLNVLGLTNKSIESNKSMVKTMGTILNHIGLEVTKTKRYKGMYHYKLLTDNYRDEIFSYWRDRETWTEDTICNPDRIAGSKELAKPICKDLIDRVYEYVKGLFNNRKEMQLNVDNIVKELGLTLTEREVTELFSKLPSVGVVKGVWMAYNF